MALRDDPKKKKPYAYQVGQNIAKTVGTVGQSITDSGTAMNTAQRGVGNAVAGTLDTFGRGLAGAPVTPPPQAIAAPRPAVTAPRPVVQPAVAAPGASATQARLSPGGAPAPRNPAQLDQASQAEVAARTQAPRPGTSMGAGAPSRVGRAALRPDGVSVVRQNNGVNAYSATGASVAAAQGAMGSVNQQNFGTQPQAAASLARPGVASTFGMGVNDPRMNDQIARPQITLGPNQTAGNGRVRGPDAMAEQYNSRESREAAKKLSGDLDTDLFRLSFKAGQGGRNGRAAMDAMAAIRGQQSAIAGGQASLDGAAIQGRANRDNQFNLASMSEQGDQRRAELQAMVARDGQQVTREGQQLSFQGDQLKLGAEIARPETITAADGTVMRVGRSGPADTVVDAQGNPVKGQQQANTRDYQQESDNKLFADLVSQKVDAMGNPLPNAVELAMADMAQYRGAAQPQAQAAQGQTATNPKTGEKLRLNPQTGKWEPLK